MNFNAFFPNKEQLLSLVRSIILIATSYVVGKGWLSANLAAEIGGMIVAALAALWGISAKTEAAQVAKAATIVPIPSDSQRIVGITSIVHPS